MSSQSDLSLEYVRVAVAAKENGATVDPTTDPVAMAFPVQFVDPVSGDWKTAEWETAVSNGVSAYYARCLVGPSGTVTLTKGHYDVWVKVSDSPEVPARKAGQHQIT